MNNQWKLRTKISAIKDKLLNDNKHWNTINIKQSIA